MSGKEKVHHWEWRIMGGCNEMRNWHLEQDRIFGMEIRSWRQEK
jgi:hypothetical protein